MILLSVSVSVYAAYHCMFVKLLCFIKKKFNINSLIHKKKKETFTTKFQFKKKKKKKFDAPFLCTKNKFKNDFFIRKKNNARQN